MQLIPPATSCEHTGEMSSSLLETWCSAFLLGTGHIGTLRPAWAKTRNSQKKSRCLPWTTVSAQVIWAQWATPIRKWSGPSWIPSFQMPVTGQPSTQACLRITGLRITTWAPSAWTPLHHTHVCLTHTTHRALLPRSRVSRSVRESGQEAAVGSFEPRPPPRGTVVGRDSRTATQGIWVPGKQRPSPRAQSPAVILPQWERERQGHTTEDQPH